MSTVTGNLASPIGHTRGLPVPTQPRPLTNRRHVGTSPFGDPNVPTPPDPDAIARLVRQGRLKPPREPKPAAAPRTTRTPAPAKPKRAPRPPLDLPAIAAAYEAGAGLTPLAREHRVNHERLRALLVEHGVTIRPTGGSSSDIPIERLVELNAQGLSNVAVGKAVGLSGVAVGMRLRNAGIKSDVPGGGSLVRDRLLEHGVTSAQVRAWCAETGRVMGRGVPSLAIVDAYLEAHPDVEAK